MLWVHLVQVDFQKRFPMYRTSSLYQAAVKNRRLPLHEDSEQLQDDCESGTTQNCWPSQDHGNPWIRSENSLGLVIPELEP